MKMVKTWTIWLYIGKQFYQLLFILSTFNFHLPCLLMSSLTKSFPCSKGKNSLVKIEWNRYFWIWYSYICIQKMVQSFVVYFFEMNFQVKWQTSQSWVKYHLFHAVSLIFVQLMNPRIFCLQIDITLPLLLVFSFGQLIWWSREKRRKSR